MEWKSMKSLRTVVQEMAAQLVVTRNYSIPLCMRLRYEPADPYVVRATFFTHSDDPGEWVLGRDLLADGLSGSAGEGDIRIWSATGHGGQGLYIALGSSAGTALLQVPVQDVRTFLGNSEALVPRGAESGHIDWDIELANLRAER
ncbi:SsgA family sporulation/cell division regulator [Streptomyces sp. NPDC005498]|uniref:SsgA family sporulation/cell division regulator n=1 Tax=Streptomyces sp. NPDC005498 TaxID=3364717 RepID=UPI0036778B87